MKVSDKSASMTHFMGHRIEATYAQIEKVFGKPQYEDIDGKVSAQWVLETENGELGTLYDWKVGFDATVWNSRTIQWHIGSHNELNAGKVQDALIKLGFEVPTQPHYLLSRLTVSQ